MKTNTRLNRKIFRYSSDKLDIKNYVDLETRLENNMMNSDISDISSTPTKTSVFTYENRIFLAQLFSYLEKGVKLDYLKIPKDKNEQGKKFEIKFSVPNDNKVYEKGPECLISDFSNFMKGLLYYDIPEGELEKGFESGEFVFYVNSEIRNEIWTKQNGKEWSRMVKISTRLMEKKIEKVLKKMILNRDFEIGDSEGLGIIEIFKKINGAFGGKGLKILEEDILENDGVLKEEVLEEGILKKEILKEEILREENAKPKVVISRKNRREIREIADENYGQEK